MDRKYYCIEYVRSGQDLMHELYKIKTTSAQEALYNFYMDKCEAYDTKEDISLKKAFLAQENVKDTINLFRKLRGEKMVIYNVFCIGDWPYSIEVDNDAVEDE